VASYVFLPEGRAAAFVARHRSPWAGRQRCASPGRDESSPRRVSTASRSCLRRSLVEAWHVDEGDLALYLAEATKAATERVQRRLGDAAKLLPSDVVARLADADVRLEGAQTAKPIEDFLGNAYAALESVFGWMVSLYPDPSLLTALGHDAPRTRRCSDESPSRSASMSSERTLPLLSVTRGVVKGAICFGNKTLPGRLAAALLAAQRNGDHPLATLGAREPGALEFFAQIGKLRIDASHDTVCRSDRRSRDRDA
jgi:hypothetical protein